MSDERHLELSASTLNADFRESRINALISVNLNTFWNIAVIVLAFSVWDYYVDAAHWRSAFTIRVIGTALVVATGIYQKLPGRARALPMMAKLRLVIAGITSVVAASMLDEGYGFGVAGLIVIVLTGPYIAVDSRDLLQMNVAVMATLLPVIFAVGLSTFDMVGTTVFLLLGVAVSSLLGRVLEASHRRAFMLEREQHRDARTDALTGLSNRRAMDERGRIELKRARRSGSPVSVILADLDHFKTVNDGHGHEVGDAALVTTATVLKNALRESDALGRWGGEEFIAVLPMTPAAGAAEVAERMRAAIAATKFDRLPKGATISLGVATSEPVEDPGMEWDLLLKEADRRLYRAKHEGRNRVVNQ